MGPVLRITGVWFVTTTLTVLGVSAAIDRVAGEVHVARPAPMTEPEVDEQLRERRQSAPAATTSAPTSTSTLPSEGSPSSIPTIGAPPTTIEPPRPEDDGPSGPGGPSAGSTTTLAGVPTGRQGERDEGPRP